MKTHRLVKDKAFKAPVRRFPSLGMLALASFQSLALSAGASEAMLGNESLELRFVRENGGLRLGELVNRISGRTVPVTTDDFRIAVEGGTPLQAVDFRFARAVSEDIPGGRCLKLHFDGATNGLGLMLRYELGDHDHFARRWLELTASKPLPLREVDAWRVGIAGLCTSQESGVPHYMNDPCWLYKPEHKGFGLPVFLEDTFWGLEHPGGYNHFTNDLLTLTHFPGRTVTNRFVSKPAVLGVAESGQVQRRFRQYVRTFQATPPDRGLFVNYNTWETLMPPTEAGCVQILDLFRQKMGGPSGVALDSFTLDDGWDDKNSLWSIRASGFPKGFALLRDALPSGTKLGLWISPSSGYGHSGWLASQGYKPNANSRWMCESDSRYLRDMTKATTELVKDNDLAFLKLDTWAATCDAQGHEHLPGNFAKEASIDAFLDYLAAIRKTQPHIFLDATCGVWLSPWFLKEADALWGEVWDGIPPSSTVPALNDIEGACTSRDKLFRNRCEETPSFPPEAIEHLGIYTYMAANPNGVMSTIGRGCHLLTFYVDVRRFTDENWAFVSAALKWAKANEATLTGDTRIILGDPLKREPYGYAHFVGDRGIVCLRNPFIEPRTVTFKPDTGKPCMARIVYPRHETLPRGNGVQLRLDAYETVILQFDPVPEEPALAGIPATETKRAGQSLVYKVFAPAGSTKPVTLLNSTGLKRARFNGQPIPFRDGALTLPFSGEPRFCNIESGNIAVRSSNITAACVADIPAGTKAALHLLVDRAGKEARATATVNGIPADLHIVRAPAVRHYPRPLQELPQGQWAFYSLDLPTGHDAVVVSLDFPGTGQLETSWWLCAESPMAEGELELEFGDALPALPVEPLPLPVSMVTRHETLSVGERNP